MGQALAISPNGKALAIARGFTIAPIDATLGHVITVFENGSSCVLAGAFSPDGMLLVSASKDGAIRVWDVHTGWINYWRQPWQALLQNQRVTELVASRLARLTRP